MHTTHRLRLRLQTLCTTRRMASPLLRTCGSMLLLLVRPRLRITLYGLLRLRRASRITNLLDLLLYRVASGFLRLLLVRPSRRNTGRRWRPLDPR